ncbi:hypothetical protein KKA85_04330 [bacterium]|nr:hypothetical protein [bacterium]
MHEQCYFYHGYGYGTDAIIHPLRMLINGGYGIMQLSNRHNRPLDINYRQGWKNVWRNLLDPTAAIQVEGWGDFFVREIIPFSLDSKKAHYWPNYTQHLIGGGMSYRMMVEWYRAHDYAHPGIWGGTTIMLYHLLNEVVENDYRDTWSTDPVADLLIFDPASIILFSSERVCRFFGETLHMADWSYQHMIDLEHETLVNNGQNFAFKLDVPWWEKWAFFYHYGTHGEFGLTRRLGGGRNISAGGGFKVDELLDVTEYHQGAELAVTGGVFYDRDDSLLASVLWANSKDYKLRVNLYPGLFEAWGLKPGFMFNLNRNRSTAFGVTLLNLPLPCGLAVGMEPTQE